MKRRPVQSWKLLPLLVVLIFPKGLPAQQGAAPAAPAPAQKGAAAAAKPAAASTTALDNLLAPIALYPDALVAQILEASKDLAAVEKFAGWLKSNSALKGSELQDAAQKAGHRAGAVPPGDPDARGEAGLDQAARRSIHKR